MGFQNEEKVLFALDQESGNIERAIDRMVAGEEEWFTHIIIIINTICEQ